MAEEGNGDVGGDAGRPGPRGLVERKRRSRRSLWASRGSEGGPVATRELVGGGGCVRSGRERGSRGGRFEGGRVSETVSGIGTACGSRPRVEGLVGKQEVAARPCACEHATASGRGEEDDGGLQWWRAGPASAAGRTGRRQVSTLSLSLCFLFSIFCNLFLI